MNELKVLFIFSMMGLFMFGCSNEPSRGNDADSGEENSASPKIANNLSTADYEKMAKELCKCMKPMADIQKRIEKLAAEGKMEEIKSLLPEMEKLTEKGDQCVEDLEAKYGKVIAEEDEQKADAALKKVCPEIAALLEEDE